MLNSIASSGWQEINFEAVALNMPQRVLVSSIKLENRHSVKSPFKAF